MVVRDVALLFKRDSSNLGSRGQQIPRHTDAAERCWRARCLARCPADVYHEVQRSALSFIPNLQTPRSPGGLDTLSLYSKLVCRTQTREYSVHSSVQTASRTDFQGLGDNGDAPCPKCQVPSAMFLDVAAFCCAAPLCTSDSLTSTFPCGVGAGPISREFGLADEAGQALAQCRNTNLIRRASRCFVDFQQSPPPSHAASRPAF